MPRFVLLFHELPSGSVRASHWDLMLENGDGLYTWELNQTPVVGADWNTCKQLPVHRMAYLDYEGPVSNDRGHVSRWDAGELEWVARSDSTLQVRLTGKKVRGTLFLEGQADDWLYRLEAFRVG